MTTIAWDGRTIAADKMAVSGYVKTTCTKIWRVGEWIYGCTGNFDEALRVKRWFEVDNADFDKAPKLDEGGCYGIAVHVQTRIAYVVEGKVPVMWPVETEYHAAGSGREFATAAMAMGRTARQAIELAAQFDASTGMGVDAFDVDTTGGA